MEQKTGVFRTEIPRAAELHLTTAGYHVVITAALPADRRPAARRGIVPLANCRVRLPVAAVADDPAVREVAILVVVYEEHVLILVVELFDDHHVLVRR